MSSQNILPYIKTDYKNQENIDKYFTARNIDRCCMGCSMHMCFYCDTKKCMHENLYFHEFTTIVSLYDEYADFMKYSKQYNIGNNGMPCVCNSCRTRIYNERNNDTYIAKVIKQTVEQRNLNINENEDGIQNHPLQRFNARAPSPYD